MGQAIQEQAGLAADRRVADQAATQGKAFQPLGQSLAVAVAAAAQRLR